MSEPDKELVPHKSPGRPKGSGKSALFREWALGTGIQKLFDIAEGKGHGYKIHGQKILEVGPTVGVQLEAIRLALAYGLGRPVIPFIFDDKARDPEASKRRADEVLKMLRDLENETDDRRKTDSDPASMGSGSPEIQAPA